MLPAGIHTADSESYRSLVNPAQVCLALYRQTHAADGGWRIELCTVGHAFAHADLDSHKRKVMHMSPSPAEQSPSYASTACTNLRRCSIKAYTWLASPTPPNCQQACDTRFGACGGAIGENTVSKPKEQPDRLG